MAENDERLRFLMKKHELSYRQIADMLHVSLATVTNWMRPDDNAAKRNMPLGYVELLEYKLGERS